MNQQPIAAPHARYTVDRSRGAIIVALHSASVTAAASHRASAGCDAYSTRNPLQLSSAVAEQRSSKVMRISEVHGRVAAHATSAVAEHMCPRLQSPSPSPLQVISCRLRHHCQQPGLEWQCANCNRSRGVHNVVPPYQYLTAVAGACVLQSQSNPQMLRSFGPQSRPTMICRSRRHSRITSACSRGSCAAIVVRRLQDCTSDEMRSVPLLKAQPNPRQDLVPLQPALAERFRQR